MRPKKTKKTRRDTVRGEKREKDSFYEMSRVENTGELTGNEMNSFT